MTKNLFIAGTPGVGKTTLLREVTLPKRQRIGGFYTQHILAGRIRKGFMMRTFDGQERMLAAKGMKSPHQLGKYGVDIRRADSAVATMNGSELASVAAQARQADEALAGGASTVTISTTTIIIGLLVLILLIVALR